jgi:hypothetical protein
MRRRSRDAKPAGFSGAAAKSPLTKKSWRALMSAIRSAAKRGEDVMAKKKKAKKAAKKKAKKKTAKKAAKKAKAKKKSRRTVLYSSKGKKLYAVRDKGGKFKDIQSYKRAHGADIMRKAKAEAAPEAAPAAAPAA